jgi:hypothetical protein
VLAGVLLSTKVAVKGSQPIAFGVEKFTVGTALTTIVVVVGTEQPLLGVNVMVFAPMLALDGENVPVAPLTIPFPDQTPPVTDETRFTAEASWQNGPT